MLGLPRTFRLESAGRELGLHEKRTGIVCLGLHTFCCGATLWEKKHPEVAQALWAQAASHAQPDRTFCTTCSFTCLTAEAAIQPLRGQGFADDVLLFRSGMSEVLNRHGYRSRLVRKANPPQSPETDTIFASLTDKHLGHAVSQAGF